MALGFDSSYYRLVMAFFLVCRFCSGFLNIICGVVGLAEGGEIGLVSRRVI